MYRPIFIFVEGIDDERFVNRIIEPLLAPSFSSVNIIQCSQRTAKEIRKTLGGIKKQCDVYNGQYFYLLDKDERPCITKTKEWLRDDRKIRNVDMQNIIVAVKKIEGWYLANETRMYKPRSDTTSEVDKADLQLIADQLANGDIRDYKIFLLENYDRTSARQKNSSLDYCLSRVEAL